ncbi:hypothetical protein Tco_0171750, partial [Tanacetum coccineum]
TSEVPYQPQTDSSPAHTSEVPIEHQPVLSLRPSPTASILDSIPEPTGENLGDHSSNETSLSRNQDDMTLQNVYDLCISLCKQKRFPRKSFSKKHRLHKESKQVMPEDKIDHMETENAQSEGRTREMVDEDKEFDEVRLSNEDIVSTDRPIVSTDGSKVSTDEQVEGTEEQNEGTKEIFEGTDGQIKMTM